MSGKKILTFFDYCGRNRANKHHGVGAFNDDGPIGEPGDFACFDESRLPPIWAVTFCCMLFSWIRGSRRSP